MNIIVFSFEFFSMEFQFTNSNISSKHTYYKVQAFFGKFHKNEVIHLGKDGRTLFSKFQHYDLGIGGVFLLHNFKEDVTKEGK